MYCLFHFQLIFYSCWYDYWFSIQIWILCILHDEDQALLEDFFLVGLLYYCWGSGRGPRRGHSQVSYFLQGGNRNSNSPQGLCWWPLLAGQACTCSSAPGDFHWLCGETFRPHDCWVCSKSWLSTRPSPGPSQKRVGGRGPQHHPTEIKVPAPHLASVAASHWGEHGRCSPLLTVFVVFRWNRETVT